MSHYALSEMRLEVHLSYTTCSICEMNQGLYMAAAQNVRFRSIPRDHMRSIPHDPYPWSIPLWRTWSIPMIHTHDPYLSNCKSCACNGFVSELYLWASSVSVSRIAFWVRGQGQLFDLYDLIRRHKVAPELARQNFETRGYLHKVSNPLPVPDPACSLLLRLY